jgi:hypothetical protein
MGRCRLTCKKRSDGGPGVFPTAETGDYAGMFALILWLTFGWRVGVVELIVELAICVMLYGGGGGKRIRAATHLASTRLRLRATALA